MTEREEALKELSNIEAGRPVTRRMINIIRKGLEKEEPETKIAIYNCEFKDAEPLVRGYIKGTVLIKMIKDKNHSSGILIERDGEVTGISEKVLNQKFYGEDKCVKN